MKSSNKFTARPPFLIVIEWAHEAMDADDEITRIIFMIVNTDGKD